MEGFEFYVEPDGKNALVVFGELFGDGMREAIGAVFYQPNSPVAGTSASLSYLAKCRPVSETEARTIHPALFERLDLETVVHLSLPRGDSTCGAGGELSPDVNVATCEDCLRIHGDFEKSIDLADVERGAARALFLLDYADGVESLHCPECGFAEEDGCPDSCPDVDAVQEYVRRIDGEHPGAGGDWDDVAPETTTAAEIEGRGIVRAVAGIEAVAARWMAETGLDAERFGHCLAMRAAGTGVGLIDDLPPSCETDWLPDAYPSVETFGLAEPDPQKGG